MTFIGTLMTPYVCEHLSGKTRYYINGDFVVGCAGQPAYRSQCTGPGGVLFASWATAAVTRRHTAAPLSSPAAMSSVVRAELGSSALSP
jgi:hypothetical protein